MLAPAYKLEEFLTACAKGKRKVGITSGAMQTARAHFKLETPAHVLEFIRKGRLEQLRFYNSKLWEKNPNQAIPIRVDAYEFYAGNIFGYMAFLRQPKTLFWLIKSFKQNLQPSLRNFPFAEKLEGLKTIH